MYSRHSRILAAILLGLFSLAPTTAMVTTSTKLPNPPPATAPPFQSSENRYYEWRGTKMRYILRQPETLVSFRGNLVLIHGFGGNADHWRRNVGPLAEAGFNVYAVDLLGYGLSSKVNPEVAKTTKGLNGEEGRDFSSFPLKYNGGSEVVGPFGPVGSTPFTSMRHPLGSVYNFYTWSEQITSFIDDVVGGDAFLACNSIGSCVGLQAAIDRPEIVNGVVILDPSLRLLNVKRQNPFFVPLVSAFQKLLRETFVGKWFFSRVATEETVSEVLKQAYGDPNQVSDQLVECILKPGLTEGATEVFLDFISYSSGPLPEEQLKIISKEGNNIPVGIGWGTSDPWEPSSTMELYAKEECVKMTRLFDGVGHCPQDEAPSVVNEFINEFISNEQNRQNV